MNRHKVKQIIPHRLLPIIIQSKIDVESNNELLKIYVNIINRKFNDENITLYEYNLVFRDERIPYSSFLNYVYRILRGLIYKRRVDIEQFNLEVDYNGNIQSIHFPNTYADIQSYKESKHYTKTLSESELSYYDGKPIIYVSTFNHMFSLKDNNPTLEKVEFYAI
jgi:hypothetical protein